ncbi:MAG: type II toxin-antitoxin system prevent-host-death family antitoxin [Candidatus Leucobacter sulfamidivorax]|nr:type II toxin-antitoxin system prevent-host-death family antitoxin [Candidatus Leucobacter sulfamidivorax]
MKTVSQRQMRNQSGELLREVEAGETVIVTNHGKPVAMLSPYPEGRTPLELLRALGQTRPAQAPREALGDIVPVEIDIDSAELLRESRGEW